MRLNRHTCRAGVRFLIVVIAATCGFLLVAASGAAQDVGTPQKLNSLATQSASPKIATAGTTAYVVWQGMYQGQSRVFFRERRDGVWQNEIVLDKSADEENFDPVITTDVKGNPHIVWVSRTPSGISGDTEIGTSKIHYAYRLGTEWLFPEPISVVNGQNCELPAIAVDEKARVFIAWQEGKGTVYNIYCATQDKAGMFRKVVVSDLVSNRLNLYPQIFLTPQPFIIWYETEKDSFVLRSARFYEPLVSWYAFDLPNLDNLPSLRLPVLVQDKGGVLYATWYDSTETSDRIFFGVQEASTRGAGAIIDDQSKRQNAFPAACVGSDNTIYATWYGEGDDGSQVFITRGDGLTFSPSVLCSDGKKDYCAGPQAAVDSAATVHVVWYSDTLKGGNGAIYVNSVAFK